MEKSLKNDGIKDSDSALTALESLRHVICSKPRMLTESEIELLRQSKTEIAERIAELTVNKKNMLS
jgi:hypothetical protein